MRPYFTQPHEVSIETLSQCNARCTFCPYPTLERQGTRMSDELLGRLIGEMATFEHPFYFSPFKVNEPLLDKRMPKILERVNAEVPKARIRLFSNGAALTDANIDMLAKVKNVEHLWVSLNSHDPEEYERIMGLPFERTARRLDSLHKRVFPHEVVLSTVGWPNEAFRRYCFERWPKFTSIVTQKYDWLGWTTTDAKFVPDTPCQRWLELSITATGKAALCCMDAEAAYSPGDVNHMTLLDVYARTKDLRRRRDREGIDPCGRCTYGA